MTTSVKLSPQPSLGSETYRIVLKGHACCIKAGEILLDVVGKTTVPMLSARRFVTKVGRSQDDLGVVHRA
jgi:hypothetical protein